MIMIHPPTYLPIRITGQGEESSKHGKKSLWSCIPKCFTLFHGRLWYYENSSRITRGIAYGVHNDIRYSNDEPWTMRDVSSQIWDQKYTKIEIKKRGATAHAEIQTIMMKIIFQYFECVAENVQDSNGGCRCDVYEPPHEHVQWGPLYSWRTNKNNIK